MRDPKLPLAAFLLIPVLTGFGLLGCGKKPAPTPPPPPQVDVAEVLERTVPLFAEFIGQTETTAVEVRARVEGIIQQVVYQEGTEVEAGQLLFVIEREPIEQRLRRARAHLAELNASLAKAQADVARLKPLADERAIPRQDYDNALAQLDRAAAGVDSGKADVRTAELDFTYCEVRAPIAGLIGAKQADVGSLVGRGQPTLLATISPLDPITVASTISEVEYLRTRREAGERAGPLPVELLLPDGTTHPHLGRFTFADRAVDPTTGTLKIRADFPNPEKIIRPGQFARLRVRLRDREKALLVPQRAVQEIQGLYNIWSVGADRKATFRRVELGARVGNLWLVEKGLAPGDRLVVEGLNKVRPGLEVDPKPATISDAPIQALLGTNAPASR